MIEEKDIKFISVSELNNYIKFLFDNTPTLQNIALHGEISNYVGKNRSGHIYFSLKDENSSIKAVMFKYDTFSLTFEPKNGDEVILYGSVSSYPPNGTYQIIVKRIDLYGQGAILLKKEQLKAKLQKEGYFNEDHKLPIPLYPKNIAIITGKNSAACADMVTNIYRRFPLTDVTVFYSLVQGNEASKDLIKNLKKAEKACPDLIIIGRGGGSIEDLTPFDDEELAKAIYACKIPIISAVGHEINRSICDYVADKYVSTPTGAAEAAVPDKAELLDELSQIKNLIESIGNKKIDRLNEKLIILKSKPSLSNIQNIYDGYDEKINNKKKHLNQIILNQLIILDKDLKNYKDLINAFNPNNLLSKGYSIVFKDNKIINSKQNLNLNDELSIQMLDGSIKVKIKEK
jgi:exodeoxyribonuclease VII large subunit